MAVGEIHQKNDPDHISLCAPVAASAYPQNSAEMPYEWAAHLASAARVFLLRCIVVSGFVGV